MEMFNFYFLYKNFKIQAKHFTSLKINLLKLTICEAVRMFTYYKKYVYSLIVIDLIEL